jgi:hypothetical protein
MKGLVLSFALLCSCSLYAQTNRVIGGYLKDSATGEPIIMASVKNNQSKQTVITNSKGFFTLTVSPNQLISFSAVGYHFDTIYYSNHYLLQDTLQLHLSLLVTSLTNVTVTAKGMSRYQLDSLQRHKDFFQAMGSSPLPTVSGANYGAGVALNLDRFSKREKSKRKAIDYFTESEQEAYINYRYTPELVTRYSGLKEDKLIAFMGKSRPSWEWLRKHPKEEDLTYYINEQLKKYPPIK